MPRGALPRVQNVQNVHLAVVGCRCRPNGWAVARRPAGRSHLRRRAAIAARELTESRCVETRTKPEAGWRLAAPPARLSHANRRGAAGPGECPIEHACRWRGVARERIGATCPSTWEEHRRKLGACARQAKPIGAIARQHHGSHFSYWLRPDSGAAKRRRLVVAGVVTSRFGRRRRSAGPGEIGRRSARPQRQSHRAAGERARAAAAYAAELSPGRACSCTSRMLDARSVSASRLRAFATNASRCSQVLRRVSQVRTRIGTVLWPGPKWLSM